MGKGLMGGEPVTNTRGMRSRGGGHYYPPGTSVAGKRANSTPDSIKRKMEAGARREDTPERGFVRVGKTVTDILVGVEDVSLWEDEEIRRCKKRDKNGGWRGRDPVVVPMALHQESIKRTFEEAQTLFREGLVPAVRYLTSIVEDPGVEDKDKLKAVSMILDRVMGKPVERVEINTEPDPWEEVVRVAIVSKPIEAIETKEVE